MVETVQVAASCMKTHSLSFPSFLRLLASDLLLPFLSSLVKGSD